MPATDLALLVDAARAAGDIARRHFHGDPDIWHKPGGEGPVTEADIDIDRMLRAELTGARPGHGWLSEETHDDGARLAAEKVFIVDPIDGTRAFINGETTFAHSLALAEHGRITAAVVYLPMMDALYAAGADTAATLNGAPIAVSDAPVQDARVLATKVNFAPGNWPGGVPPVTRHFRASLAYRLCLVAQGRFDAMLTLRRTWEWDVAAGSLIVTRAGGVVSDRMAGPPAFNAPCPRLNGILAAGRTLHSGLLTHLRPAT